VATAVALGPTVAVATDATTGVPKTLTKVMPVKFWLHPLSVTVTEAGLWAVQPVWGTS
jgi:hypothetical protein